MNDRISKIINLLFKNPNYKVSDLEKITGLSRRQINYALKQLNEKLAESNLPIIKKDSTGLITVPQEVIQDYAKTDKEKENFYFENERVDLICLYLALSDEEVSLNHLMDILMVSKNTAVNDIKNSNAAIENYNICIEYSRSKGYHLLGSEGDIRNLIEAVVERTIKFKRDFSAIDDYFTIRKDEVIHLIREIEKRLHISYSDESFDFLANILMYVFHRIRKKGVHIQGVENEQIKQSKEYKALLLMLQGTVYEADIGWISLKFMASDIYIIEKSHLDVNNDQLFQLIHKMVAEFQRMTLIEVSDCSEFEMRLYNHLRPACFRIMYDIAVRDGHGNVNRQSYNTLKIMILELIKPIENYIGKSFPDDELELLTLYFGSQLHDLDKELSPKAKAVVVCSNGLIVSRMMLELLKRLFPEIHFLTALSIREFEQFSSDYDLVFTTSPLNTTIYQYIINPIMTDEEQLHLRYRVLEDIGLLNTNQKVNAIVKTIEKYAKIDDLDALKTELGLRLGNKNLLQNDDCLPKLSYYMKPDWMQITEEHFAWKEAIRFAFKPMLFDHSLERDYTEMAIADYQNNQSYSFFGKSTAVPHIDAKELVHQEIIGFTVFKKVVVFPKGQQIHIIAPIAIIDTTKHLLAVKELAEYVMDDHNIEKILSIQNKQTLYQMICERK
ncbi:PTS sugar transporter subunit IIA [Streptococcus sp. H31]|uniref:PTS sugar transporter subunit IIA n=1 Tax=Streptococcus huangxiaojuni TaxID=3237239 RepID=UPI0034A4A386